MGIVRHMLPQSTKPFLNMLLWIISGVCLLNYMCFGRNLGNLSPFLVYLNDISFTNTIKIINFFILCGLCVIFVSVFKYKKFITIIYTILIFCISILSFVQIHTGQILLKEMSYIKKIPQKTVVEPIFSLSKNGKNVIIFMLDRAISGYVPYFLEEKPILKNQFVGFTYYPNTISFGFYTNYGTPPLFGGYEYTPIEINKRTSESLVDKHNEALKVLPALFSKNNYSATVCDPPLAGYKNYPDISIFDDILGVSSFHLRGSFKNNSLNLKISEKPLYLNNRNFFCYSLFKCFPLAFSLSFYDKGNYFSSNKITYNSTMISRLAECYSVLTLLPKLTNIETNNSNNFLSITNDTTHEPCVFQLPDYELKEYVNNAGFKTAADGKIKMNNYYQISHYHVNMAAFLQLGKWFDFMRENGVYDNTRIIIAADHGRGLGQFDYMLNNKLKLDVEWCNSLLMFKDFNSTEFTVSNEFMTQADIPTLASKDIINIPLNPFTGKIINNKEKSLHPQIITTSHNWRIEKHNKTTFDTSDGEYLSVHDDIFNPDNWEKVEYDVAP